MAGRIICAECKSTGAGPLVKSPGPVLGSIVIDRLVCRECQVAYQSYMENKFWRGDGGSGHGKCPRCQVGLNSQNSMPAYRRANDDGAWEIVLLCNGCHAEYRKYCTQAAAQ